MGDQGCSTQLVPANSKGNPPKDTAELTSKGDGASVKMFLRAENSREGGGTLKLDVYYKPF